MRPHGRSHEPKAGEEGPGPLLSLLVLFGDAEVARELFSRVRWANGIHYPKGHTDIVKFCKYGEFQRYTCKTCKKTFNDKTRTLLHYRHISLGNWNVGGLDALLRAAQRQIDKPHSQVGGPGLRDYLLYDQGYDG